MVHPVLSGGYVLEGGALCMELMTPQVSVVELCFKNQNCVIIIKLMFHVLAYFDWIMAEGPIR